MSALQPCRHGTAPEPILNQYYLFRAEPILNESSIILNESSTNVRMHPFTFWFSRTDQESKMPAGKGFIFYNQSNRNVHECWSKSTAHNCHACVRKPQRLIDGRSVMRGTSSWQSIKNLPKSLAFPLLNKLSAEDRSYSCQLEPLLLIERNRW